MSKRIKITELGIIKCPHGGIAQLKGKSSTPNQVCGGVPTMNMQDLPGVPISSCKKGINRCTVISSATSACCETNIKAAGVNPSVDAVSVKTNNGSTMTISDPDKYLLNSNLVKTL